MNRDHYRTPAGLIAAIERFMGLKFTLDVCATEENAIASAFFTEVDDALYEGTEWKTRNGGMVFMNPPYSNLLPWVTRAERQARAHGVIVVGVLPDDRSTNWYQFGVFGKATMELIPQKRISFLHPETGEPVSGNPKGTVCPVWTPWRTGTTQTIKIEV